MAIKVETVGDLITALGKFDPGTRVVATWEGIWREIAVYRHADGDCVLDVDGCYYEKGFSDGSTEFGPIKP